MNYSDEYRARLCTADEAVRLVKNGDWVDYASNNAKPVLLDRALARRRDELHGVKIRGNLTPGPLAVVECDPEMEHFVYHTWHCSGYERKLCDAGRAFFTPMIFRNLGWYYRTQLTVNVAMFCVSPMDSHGYFSFGGSTGVCRDIADTADVIILEVNEAVPRVLGEGESIHISEVTHVVEAGRLPLWDMQSPEPSETDTMIARHIFPHIHDGATVQLGIGGMPNALGRLIAESDLHDLGMHTELCSDGYLAMFRAGKLTNRRKPLHTGKGVYGLAVGSEELYDWINDNPGLMAMPLSYVNDPYVIAKKRRHDLDKRLPERRPLRAGSIRECGNAPDKRHRRPAGFCDRSDAVPRRQGIFVHEQHLPRQGRSSPFSRAAALRRRYYHNAAQSGVLRCHRIWRGESRRTQHVGACGRDDIHRPPRLPRRAYTRGRAAENMAAVK